MMMRRWCSTLADLECLVRCEAFCCLWNGFPSMQGRRGFTPRQFNFAPSSPLLFWLVSLLLFASSFFFRRQFPQVKTLHRALKHILTGWHISNNIEVGLFFSPTVPFPENVNVKVGYWSLQGVVALLPWRVSALKEGSISWKHFPVIKIIPGDFPTWQMAFNTGDKWQWKYFSSLQHTTSWGGNERKMSSGSKWAIWV